MTAASNQLSYICTLLYSLPLAMAAELTHHFLDTGRAITGFACGAVTATVPSYIAELSIPSIRGILTGLFEVTYQIGSVVGFWINYSISQNLDLTSTLSWRLPMAVQIIPGGILLIGGFFLHESPLWLLRKKRAEEAHRALESLRHIPVTHQYLQEELGAIQVRLEEEAVIARGYGTGFYAYCRGALKELSMRGMRNRVWWIWCAFTLQNLSGAAGE